MNTLEVQKPLNKLNDLSEKTIILVGIYNQQFPGTILSMVFDFQEKRDESSCLPSNCASAPSYPCAIAAHRRFPVWCGASKVGPVWLGPNMTDPVRLNSGNIAPKKAMFENES